jgi:hypothetical protein
MKRWMPLFALLLIAGTASACPMCKDSIPNSNAPNAGGLPVAFNWSCYLMLGGFLMTLGLVSVGMFRAAHSTQRAKPEQRGFPVK